MMPGQVCVPAHPAPALDDGEPRVRIELRRRGDDLVAVVFRSVAGLVAALGAAQPWMVMDTERLRVCLAAAGVKEVLLDPDLSSSTGRWQLEDLRRFAGGPLQ
jgi:hypothetical protein